MIGNKDRYLPAVLCTEHVKPSPEFRKRLGKAKQGPGRGYSHDADNLRGEQGNLPVKKGKTGPDIFGIRLTRLRNHTLNDIGYIDLVQLQIDRRQHTDEHLVFLNPELNLSRHLYIRITP